MVNQNLEVLDDSVKASVLTAYTVMAESNKNRRLSLLTITPLGSLLTMVGTIWGGSNNQALSNLSFPIGLFGVLFVVGLFYIALGSTKHDKEYQAVIHALGNSLHLPLSSEPIRYAPKVISFLFATSVGCLVCVGTWFILPGFGIMAAIAGALIAGAIGMIVGHNA